jgi:hypothetical protein
MDGDSKSTAYQDDRRPLSLDFQGRTPCHDYSRVWCRGQVPGAGARRWPRHQHRGQFSQVIHRYCCPAATPPPPLFHPCISRPRSDSKGSTAPGHWCWCWLVLENIRFRTIRAFEQAVGARQPKVLAKTASPATRTLSPEILVQGWCSSGWGTPHPDARPRCKACPAGLGLSILCTGTRKSCART